MSDPSKKHSCPDCRQCQWCSDNRCQLCLKSSKGCRKKLSMAEQIELYERLNAPACPHSGSGKIRSPDRE